MGNGTGLSIFHIGSNHIHTPSATFHLNNMLHVPSMTTNLIYVRHFAADNNCLFVFYTSNFCIKDKATRNTFFREQSENVLYPFPLRCLSSNSNKTTPLAYVGTRVLVSIWHSQLGHHDSPVLHYLISTFNLPIEGSCKLSPIYTECQMGKSKKLPILISNFVSSPPLDIFHYNL